MTVPKNEANKMWKKHQRIQNKIKCQKQFPDCPEELNDINCKGCPYYKVKK